MRVLLSYIVLLFATSGCKSFGSGNIIADTIRQLRPLTFLQIDSLVPRSAKIYTDLIYEKAELLPSAPGTKSVLFNSTGSKLYAMNLEGMSVYEFDQPSRKVTREFKFKPTKGTGWDYVKEKPIPSYQEKPVEACFSHDDKILWVSLHNAGGIVPIWIDSFRVYSNSKVKPDTNKQAVKHITIAYPGANYTDLFDVPLVKTGKTPKVISKTADSKYLLVSNWHSYTISVLELNKDEYPYAKLIATIPVSSIPRGIVVDDRTGKSYVAIMGGATIAVISNSVWMKEDDLNVASNPRHIVMDSSDHIFVSYNRLAQIACINAETGKTLFTATTHAQPRTIVLSKNYKFLFVTCYSADTVDVYKINENSFSKIASLPCKGHPVGVDVFENNDKLEAWVCSYSTGSISVFSFKKRSN